MSKTTTCQEPIAMISNYPDILLDFACKCGSCRRTCCRHDWNVNMSEAQFFENRSLAENGSQAIKDAFATMKPDPKSTGPQDYAYVEMVGDVLCPLQDEQGLCQWRSLTGRSVCSTCSSFPCTIISYCDQEYRMPSGGCEAVLESLLQREEPIRMVCSEITSPEGDYYLNLTEEVLEARPVLKLYPLLVEWGLNILQNRALPLDERVGMLVTGLAEVARLETQGDSGAIERFLRDPSAIAALPSDVSDERTSWLPVFVCGEMFSHFASGSAHRDAAIAMMEGLGIGLREELADGKIRCLPVLGSKEVYPAKRRQFAKFFGQREIFFEHVTVSLFLKMLIPLREPDVWTHTCYFACMYAALKGGVVGAFAPQEPTDEQLVDQLVHIIRMGTHSQLLYPTLAARLRETRLTSLPVMQALVCA